VVVIVAGIDPGKTGALAVIDLERRVLMVHITPTIRVGKTKRDYDVGAMRDLLLCHPIQMCMIERQQAFPGQGRSSALSLGVGYGIWLGLLGALDVPHQIVSPRLWSGMMMRGVEGVGKQRNIKAARLVFPKQSLLATERSRKPHDGIADALLIAEYCSRTMRN